MTEAYTPSPVVPTFPLTLPVDGEIINHSNLIDGMVKKGLDYTAAVSAAAVATDAANMALLAKQTASSGDTLIGVLTMAAASAVGLGTSLSSTLRTKLQFIFDTAISDQPSTAIAPGASAVTIDATVSRVYHVDTPTQATQTVTLKSTSPTPQEGFEIHFAAYSIANTKNVIVERENATQIVIMTGAASGTNFGSARFKFISGVWRLLLATGLAAHGGVVDGAINNP